jgi:hypothetical protein
MEFAPNPLGFITNRRLMIRGSTTGQDLLTNPNAASYQNTVDFLFCYNPLEDRFEFATFTHSYHGGSHRVPAVNVPALHWTDVPRRGNTVLPTANLQPQTGFAALLGIELAGASWMLTTQLTGCSFCYMAQGGTAYAAHVSPAGSQEKPIMSGNELAQQLMGNVNNVSGGTISNYPAGGARPAFQVFGNGAGNAVVYGGGHPFYPPKARFDTAGQMKMTSIFGRFHGGVWEFYTQSVDGVNVIMEHRRIL